MNYNFFWQIKIFFLTLYMKNKNRKKPYIYDQQVVNKNDFTVYINELAAIVKKNHDSRKI
jgi:hypothetical protein